MSYKVWTESTPSPIQCFAIDNASLLERIGDILHKAIPDLSEDEILARTKEISHVTTDILIEEGAAKAHINLSNGASLDILIERLKPGSMEDGIAQMDATSRKMGKGGIMNVIPPRVIAPEMYRITIPTMPSYKSLGVSSDTALERTLAMIIGNTMGRVNPKKAYKGGLKAALAAMPQILEETKVSGETYTIYRPRGFKMIIERLPSPSTDV